jgi:hypothetical protein
MALVSILILLFSKRRLGLRGGSSVAHADRSSRLCSGAVSKATVDDADPRIQYGGLATTVWQTNNNPNFRNGTLHFSESGSAQATWEFDGDAVAVYGTASPNHGDLQVLVDGTVQQTVTPYAGVDTVHDQVS